GGAKPAFSGTRATMQRLAAFRSSCGTRRRETTALATQITPGTRKAARHPKPARSAAVVPAASAAPRLPHTPLKASERPRRVACWISMAVPTGWEIAANTPSALIAMVSALGVGADGREDRREHPERAQRRGEQDEVRRDPRRHQRKAAAGVEHHHHVAPAPAVAKPARRQREHTKGDEGRRAERDQFGIAAAVD